MNQLRNLLRSFLILLVISFLSSCEEELSEVPFDNEIEEAREFFEENVDQSIDPGSRSRKSRRNIRKNLDWDNAWIKREPNKVSVIVPLDYDESLYTHKNGGVFNLSDWTYAMIIKEKGQKRQALIVTSMPDQDFLNSDSESPLDFSGLVLVEDWKGNLLKALQHKDGEIREVTSLEVTEEEVEESGGRGRVMDMNYCTIMDWFVCVGNEQIGWNCTYSHSEYLCPVIGGGTGVCFYCPGNGDGDPPPPGGHGSTGEEPVDPTLPCVIGKVRDSDGNCVTEEELRESELIDLLDLYPELLVQLPCEELQKYQDLARHNVPDEVSQKLQDLSELNQSFLEEISGFESFRIQDLNNAYGTIVNMDYFPVTINQLPSGHTAETLLNHIRMNINSFTNDDAVFSPYPGLSGESTIWNSNDPLGAILTIDLFPHDGSVIVTETTSNKWIFSVIRSPLDIQHPISGNREFGFTQNNDGTITFYTRGVDRLTQPITAAVGELADELGIDILSQADPLWMSFQDKISEFVNQNGGSSTLPSERNQGDRPDWLEVKRFLNGEISISELRNDC